MRTIISIILLALCHTMSFAQGWVDDIWFNKPKSAVFINDVFVKDFIGFNIGKDSGVADIKKGVPLDKPLVINGVTYYGKTNITCEKKLIIRPCRKFKKVDIQMSQDLLCS